MYESFFKTKPIALWDLVPNSSLAVYQRGNCSACVDSIKRSSWALLFREKLTRRNVGDTTISSVYFNLLSESQLISMHQTTKHDFELAFYLNKVSDKVWRDAMKAAKFVKRDRLFSGLTIEEVSVNKTIIAWVDIADYRVISFSPVLIEDVIRAVQDKEGQSFKKNLMQVSTLPTVKNDGGDVLINLKMFTNALSLFAENGFDSPLNIGTATVLDVKRNGGTLVLNGFTDVDSADRNALLTVFETQTPVAFGLKKFVSNDAQFVAHFGFSDCLELGTRLQNLTNNTTRKSLMDALQIKEGDIASLYAGLGKELALVSMEVAANQSSTVLMIGIKGSGDWMKILDRVAEDVSVDTVFSEFYSNYTIKKIESKGFVELIFPILKKQFNEIYYTQVGDAVLMGDDLRSLKMQLNDIEGENTWGKSVEKNRFLESTLLESNVSFFVDPTKSKKLVTDMLYSEWRTFFKANNSLLETIGLSAFQFSNLNENFYTNICLTFSPTSPSMKMERRKEVFVNLATGVASSVYSVKNHNDRSYEVLLQDSSYNVCLINQSGAILWQKKLDGFIKSSVEQIDFYANGKLQYLLSTEKKLYIIDRLGNYVEGYPVDLSFAASAIRSIDYDYSKKYRFVLMDKMGVVRMTDKQGKVLDGWTGLQTGGELLSSPKHFRIAARDYIAMLRKDGKFLLYNRRGERLSGFPVDLKGRSRDDFYLQVGAKNEKTAFVFVDGEGYRVKVGLNGEEISRETLVKPMIETHFKLVNELTGKSYVIVRQDNKSLTIMNDQLQEVVVNEFIGLNNAQVQHFDFGSGNVFYTIVDTDQDLGYVYSVEGKLLTEQPIECSHLTLLWEKNILKTVTTFNNRLQLQELE